MFQAKSHPYLDLYAMLWHIVRYWPVTVDAAGQEIMGTRPDTFAALGSLDDINTSTLDKDGRYADPDQHLFYSREWSEQNPGHYLQTEAVSFQYPLLAIEPQRFTVPLGKGKDAQFTELRFSLAVMDVLPGKLVSDGPRSTAAARQRTVEELEADLSSMFETVIGELGKWGAWLGGDGRYSWSPMPVAGGRLTLPMRETYTASSVEATFYRDFGVDRISGVQGFLTVRMPRLICYLPTGAQGLPINFEYPVTPPVPTPRYPDGYTPAA